MVADIHADPLTRVITLLEAECEAPDWRTWSLDKWNTALFDHYFRGATKIVAVRRIPVTDDELRKIVGSTDADPQEIRQHFLNKISSTDVTRMLLVSHWRGVWNEEGTPPFFAYLFLTCLAASGDEDTTDVGNFRYRLNEMLSNDVRYHLPELSKLWEYLANWLEADHERHPMNASLVLPDLGNEVRIGYSKRLAFPSQRDKNRMIALFHEQAVADDVRIDSMIRLLDRRSDRFSSSFRLDLQDFRDCYSEGVVNLDKSHFWSAVLHAIAESREISIVNLAAASLVMLVDSVGSNRLVVLLNSSDIGISLSKVCTSTALHDPTKHVLQIGLDETAADHAVELLLKGELHEHVPMIHASTLRKAVSQGVLLFGVDEHGIHELFGSMPFSGSIHLLMKKELATHLQSVCEEYGIHCVSRDSRYGGWTEILNLSAENLRQIDFSELNEFADVQCLQAPRQTFRITVRNGVRSGRAFLGHKECLPEVRALGADSITISSVSKETPDSPFTLNSVANGEDCVFSFPAASIVKPLRGRYRITARDREGVLSRRDLTFRRTTIGTDYQGPATGVHRVESGLRSTILFSELDQFDAAHSVEYLNEPRFDIGSEDDVPASMFHLELENRVSVSLNPYDHSHQEKQCVRNTEEISAALAINQRGIKQKRLYRLFDSHFPSLKPWDAIQAWVEAGCFERLTSTRGATTFVARHPRINYDLKKGEHRGTVTGLTTVGFRKRLRQEATSLGCKIGKGLSFTPCLLGPLTIHGPSRQALADVAHRLEIPFQSERMEWSRYLTHLARIATLQRKNQAPLNYNRSRVSWTASNGDDCIVTRHRRLAKRNGVEYPESQDFYSIAHNSHKSWTYCKNWAMLTGMCLAGELPFYKTSNNCVVRSSGHHVYLPLPVGRLTVLRASAVGGPLPQSQSEGRYVYPVLSKIFLTELMQQLIGLPTLISEQIHELFLCHCRSSTKVRSNLPRLVKRSLLEACDSATTRALVKGTVSPKTAALACQLVRQMRATNND